MSKVAEDKVAMLVALLDRNSGSVTPDQLLAEFVTGRRVRNALFRGRRAGVTLEVVRDGRKATSYVRTDSNTIAPKTIKAAAKAVTKAKKAPKASAPVPEFIDNVTLDENDREVKAA
jgi:hypothetical protein